MIPMIAGGLSAVVVYAVGVVVIERRRSRKRRAALRARLFE